MRNLLRNAADSRVRNTWSIIPAPRSLVCILYTNSLPEFRCHSSRISEYLSLLYMLINTQSPRITISSNLSRLSGVQMKNTSRWFNPPSLRALNVRFDLLTTISVLWGPYTPRFNFASSNFSAVSFEKKIRLLCFGERRKIRNND